MTTVMVLEGVIVVLVAVFFGIITWFGRALADQTHKNIELQNKVYILQSGMDLAEKRLRTVRVRNAELSEKLAELEAVTEDEMRETLLSLGVCPEEAVRMSKGRRAS